MTLIHLQPENAFLDSRTCEVLPRRLKSLQVVDDPELPRLRGTDIQFVAGYNTLITSLVPDTVDGGPVVTELTIDAEPGAGLGRFAGCDEDDIPVRRVAGIEADENGNLLVGTEGCYRIERPTVVVSESPRLVAIRRTGITDEQARASLLLTNNCSPCCDCSDYAAVWEAIRRLRDRYQELGLRAAAARDLHRDNILRWRKAGRNRVSNPLRLAIIPLNCCQLGVTGGYCNSSGNFLSELELRFTFSGDVPLGDPVCGQTFRAGNFERINPGFAGRVATGSRENYTLAGEWPVYSAFFSGIPKNGLALVTFQMNLAGCDTSDQVHVHLEAVNPTSGETLEYDASWPSGELMTPVASLEVYSQLQPGDTCDVSICEAPDSSGDTGTSSSSSSSSEEEGEECCLESPSSFTVAVSGVPFHTCSAANCSGWNTTFTVPPGGDTEIEGVCDYQQTFDGTGLCGSHGGNPCVSVQLDARTANKLKVIVYLQQECGSEYAKFSKIFSVSGKADCLELLDNVVIPYASSVGSLQCGLSSALVSIKANP